MLLSSNETLSELFVRLLVEPRTAAQLTLHKDVSRRGVTIQAIYKALRLLVAEGIVVKHKEVYSTSTEWLTELATLSGQTTIFTPPPGETVRYSFSSFSQVDSYWKHVAGHLPVTDPGVPFFAYLPHNFWHYIENRTTSEERFYATFNTTKTSTYIVHGGTTAGDLADKRLFRGPFVNINTITYKRFTPTEHLAIMGDFVTTTKVSPKTARAIHDLYTSCIVADLTPSIKDILTRPTRITITLENNHTKANELRAYLAKDFFIPKATKR